MGAGRQLEMNDDADVAVARDAIPHRGGHLHAAAILCASQACTKGEEHNDADERPVKPGRKPAPHIASLVVAAFPGEQLPGLPYVIDLSRWGRLAGVAFVRILQNCT
jgi:hypothetical protein